MKIPFRFGTAVLVIGYQLSAIPASAHPGHGPNEVQPAHYLVSPDHLGFLLVTTVAAFCLYRMLTWRRSVSVPKRPASADII